MRSRQVVAASRRKTSTSTPTESGVFTFDSQQITFSSTTRKFDEVVTT